MYKMQSSHYQYFVPMGLSRQGQDIGSNGKQPYDYNSPGGTILNIILKRA
jgi:hypothetical protein